MSTKRTRNTSATEPPLTPKRRSASLSTATAEVVEKGKRKIVVVGDDAGQSPTKSPKKAAVLIAITSAVTRRSSRKSLVEEEQRKEVVLDDFIEERRPRTTRSKGIVPSEEVPVTVPAKVPVKRLRPRSLRRFSPSAEEIALMQGGLQDFGEDDDDDVVTLSVKAPRDPITTRSRTAPASQDARKFYVAPVLFKESNKQEESVSLAERYWFTMYNCFRTLAPLFLAIVVFLYAVSASTNSQLIASVGLAYAFVFLGIMATFYCTALPLIVASNMVSRFIFSNGASMQKDLTRALLFFLTIGCVLFFAYYPIGLF